MGEGNSCRATSLARIIAFHVDGENGDSRELGHGILDLMASRYGLKSPQPDDPTLMFNLEGFQYRIKLIKREACNAFIIAVGRPRDEPSRGYEEDLATYQDRMRPLLQSLPDNPTATYSIYLVHAGSQDEALTTFEEYAVHRAQRHMSLGIIRGCLLGMFGEGRQGEGKAVERNLYLSPFNSADAEAVSSDLLEDISLLTSTEGEINRLYRMRQPFFRYIGSAEEDTQKAIEEVFAKRLKVEVSLKEGRLEDMEESLKVITGRFSTLSVLAGAVRRDSIAVGSQLDEVEGLLRRWDESAVEGYPTIFSMEMLRYKALSKPFKDFIDRIEALRGELGTVLDTVRTYLSVEQQKLGVEEQKSSKDLLARLVNLQEGLNKLEILIVAFYITEMGGLLFEVIAREMAPLLTAAFIPLALLTSFGLLRLLHMHR